MDWIAPPEPLTWELKDAISFGSATYHTVTLRAPTGADILKATALRGASSTQVSMQLIAGVSAENVPYEAIQLLPSWLIEQMAGYLDAFGGAPEPSPLAEWRAAMAALREAAAP